MASRRKKQAKRRTPQQAATGINSDLPSLAQLISAPDTFVSRLDVAALNLMCAGGLPGAEDLDAGRTLTLLDEAARVIAYETGRHWDRFFKSPGTYNNSPGYFRCHFLLQVLQEDFGVKYNPARVRDPSFQDPKCLDPDFRDSRDLFIHGIIDGPGGTCASMPVLYVAEGRRLGYPLKLVEARGHLFFRWDDPKGAHLGVAERFNIEGTGHGIGSYPDDYYRTWPEPWSDAEQVGGWYLKSLSPTEELAAFLCTRAECLIDNARIDEAIQAYEWVCGLMPNDARYRAHLNRLTEQRRLAAEQAYQYITALNRQNREQRERSLSLATAPQRLAVTPPHGDYCQCFHCREARQTMQPQRFPGHAAGCQCPHCRTPKPGSPTAIGTPRSWQGPR